jgi:hypothetical protein
MTAASTSATGPARSRRARRGDRPRCGATSPSSSTTAIASRPCSTTSPYPHRPTQGRTRDDRTHQHARAHAAHRCRWQADGGGDLWHDPVPPPHRRRQPWPDPGRAHRARTGRLRARRPASKQATESTIGPITDEQKRQLDSLHLAKIDLAAWVYVVNPGGYIGESTRREIAYAAFLGKEVVYSDQVDAARAGGLT